MSREDWEQEFWNELSDEEADLLKKFRNQVSDISSPCVDDYFLWRWLKSRKLNLEKAEKALRTHIRFRRNVGADTILKDYEFPEVIQKFLLFYFAGFDSEGDAIMLYKTGSIDMKGLVNSLNPMDIAKSFILHTEQILEWMRQHSIKNKKRSRRITFLHDLKGIELSMILDMKVGRTALELAMMYEANYPELLKRVFIINAPSYFYLWFNILKTVSDPDIVAKIEVHTEGSDRVCEVFGPGIIPTTFGGDLKVPEDRINPCTTLDLNSKVPRSFYLTDARSDLVKDPLSKKVKVRERGHHHHVVEVNQQKSTLRWIFEIADNDIQFSVLYAPSGGDQSLIVSPSKVRAMFKRTETVSGEDFDVLVPPQRIQTTWCPERGEIVCDRVGTYILLFDNTYSWMKSKELCYKADVLPPTNLPDDPLICELKTQTGL